MQKNLFTKYFTICAGMILASITVLGALLMGFASQYFRSDKLKVLDRYVSQATALTLTDYQKNNYLYIDETTLNSVYSVLADAIEATIFLSDTEGKILICTDTELFASGKDTVPASRRPAAVIGKPGGWEARIKAGTTRWRGLLGCPTGRLRDLCLYLLPPTV